ncbi:hypothetical protein WAI453_010058 [Rhynchosporium graminicola]
MKKPKSAISYRIESNPCQFITCRSAGTHGKRSRSGTAASLSSYTGLSSYAAHSSSGRVHEAPSMTEFYVLSNPQDCFSGVPTGI